MQNFQLLIKERTRFIIDGTEGFTIYEKQSQTAGVVGLVISPVHQLLTTSYKINFKNFS